MVAATWARCLGGHERAKVVGLTATPERLDGRGLKDHFDELIVGPVGQAPHRGRLALTISVLRAGRAGPRRRSVLGGDFNRGDIADVMKDAALIGDVVKHYRDLADGMQGIVFGVDRQHSREIAEAFNAAGISAVHLDGAIRPPNASARLSVPRRRD
jgi:DNA repair protein RadD